MCVLGLPVAAPPPKKECYFTTICWLFAIIITVFRRIQTFKFHARSRFQTLSDPTRRNPNAQENVAGKFLAAAEEDISMSPLQSYRLEMLRTAGHGFRRFHIFFLPHPIYYPRTCYTMQLVLLYINSLLPPTVRSNSDTYLYQVVRGIFFHFFFSITSLRIIRIRMLCYHTHTII